jgi:NodT family efflux transporter outer membrane factor (OMF) lipoprotein
MLFPMSEPARAQGLAGELVQPPAQWQAPLPHNGNLTDLTRWWQALGDPVLLDLMDHAQAVSPNIASAKSRLIQARSALVGAQAANRPTLDASLSAQRGVSASNTAVATVLQTSLDASWEIDVFGANRQAATAAAARLTGADANWHDARISVAAEVATLYFSWHNCEQRSAVARLDTHSRSETSRLTQLLAQAGFAAPANAALTRASVAESNANALAQQAQCDSTIKSLVALTSIDESALRNKLVASISSPDNMASVSVLPAALLSQRPDVYSAERDVTSASADLGAAKAQAYPRLTLNGSVGALNLKDYQGTIDLSTWSIGPLSLTLPIFDGGRRAANVEASAAKYDEAVLLYRSKVRQAVREVEDALLSLASTDARKSDSLTARDGYQVAFDAMNARYLAGSASLTELEDARRSLLNAQNSLLQLNLERTLAWINLYRALGGGWTTSPASPATGASSGY